VLNLKQDNDINMVLCFVDKATKCTMVKDATPSTRFAIGVSEPWLCNHALFIVIGY
jgi:hypothetical protein